METKTFVMLGESSEPIAVINATSPQELRGKTLLALSEQYDGNRPALKNSFNFTTVFDQWGQHDFIVEVHDEDEAPEEVSFYEERLSIERTISF